MAGIYVHIPFCKQACYYCDFHFSTNLKNLDLMVDAICEELAIRSNYFKEEVSTIYFGGGTPSLLSKEQLRKFLLAINSNFSTVSSPEITLEANPEDLTLNKLKDLLALGINRLSIGIQTFRNRELQWMNRIHDSEKAEWAFTNARNVGFTNVSLDLIYALPTSIDEDNHSFWESDLNQAIALGPEHISLYGLTIEEQTVFGKRKKKNTLIELPEEDAAQQYLKAISFFNDSGYDHYEVSNFAKPGFHSRHNMAYWSGKNYLGVGPGAHSFSGKARQINVRSNTKYLKAMMNKTPYFEIEELSRTQLLNEYILTGLRKADGISFKEMNEKFHVEIRGEHHPFLNQLHQQDLIVYSEESMHLTSYGFLVADEIALQLFFQE